MFIHEVTRKLQGLLANTSSANLTDNCPQQHIPQDIPSWLLDHFLTHISNLQLNSPNHSVTCKYRENQYSNNIVVFCSKPTYIYTHVCICMYIYTHIYIYIHNYTPFIFLLNGQCSPF